MIVIITGFMGTGKTSVGQLLGKKLKYFFLDIDQEIEKKHKMTIPEIFDKFGEKIFRDMESELLQKFVNEHGDMLILATGGGTLMNKQNRDLALSNGIVICLKAEPEIIEQRIMNSKSRPLLKIPVNVLLNQRKEVYDSLPFQIDTSNLSIEDVADKIIETFLILPKDSK